MYELVSRNLSESKAFITIMYKLLTTVCTCEVSYVILKRLWVVNIYININIQIKLEVLWGTKLVLRAKSEFSQSLEYSVAVLHHIPRKGGSC